MPKQKPKTDEHPEAGILYRIDGGDPIPAEEMAWGDVFPWSTVERKSPGSPWCPTLPEPPVFLAQTGTPKTPDGKYHLTEAVWPPKHYRSPR